MEEEEFLESQLGRKFTPEDRRQLGSLFMEFGMDAEDGIYLIKLKENAVSKKGGFAIRSVAALRKAFWEDNPKLNRVDGKRQNSYPTDVRQLWVDYIDQNAKAGRISEEVAFMAEL